MKQTVELGDIAKDSVSGFTGIVIAKTNFLFGCTRIGLKSRELHDGKTIDAEWFDEPQIEVVEKQAVASESRPRKDRTGGPLPATPKRRKDPPA